MAVTLAMLTLPRGEGGVVVTAGEGLAQPAHAIEPVDQVTDGQAPDGSLAPITAPADLSGHPSDSVSQLNSASLRTSSDSADRPVDTSSFGPEPETSSTTLLRSSSGSQAMSRPTSTTPPAPTTTTTTTPIEPPLSAADDPAFVWFRDLVTDWDRGTSPVLAAYRGSLAGPGEFLTVATPSALGAIQRVLVAAQQTVTGLPHDGLRVQRDELLANGFAQFQALVALRTAIVHGAEADEELSATQLATAQARADQLSCQLLEPFVGARETPALLTQLDLTCPTR